MLFRHEAISDIPALRPLIADAFRDAPHASGREAEIVDALRRDGALALSLVATEANEIVGHVAFSPVTIGGKEVGWFGLGPVAVRREARRRGVGARLTEAGLRDIRERGASGSVVLGEPTYYGRFGFVADPTLVLAGTLPTYFQSLRMKGDRQIGEVRYHPAFAGA
jgi:putative acetyltransferase